MKQSKDFFWPSYVDLMTALFLTMLVLFVVSYQQFQKKNEELRVQLEDKKKLDEIKAALKKLEDPKYFVYSQKYKRYELAFNISFKENSSELYEADKPRVLEVGRFLQKQLNEANAPNDIQYLVVVEGRTARFTSRRHDGTYSYDSPKNFDGIITRQLSYARALAVTNLWRGAGINFPAPRYELVSAGSGFGGVGRYMGKDEELNRRFIIQIQPKIGSIGQ
ncbi:OmpA family protein [Hymenobacter siberiensis]|uniref:hypothetical protein n=1 Tax=Hymenobacter siberiensis TaxID=2848396 RepID=UPI001C1E4E44|nr:hypothetical protein [Hymenobacter siberiensis]MBU6120728.1 hypothetical protein [Hymenobacter siberiensis]